MYWYFAVLQKYAVFKGRARRKEFWMFFLINLAIFPLLSFNTTIGALYLMLVLLPTVTVSVRRLHDIGLSGWWLMLLLIPYANRVLIFGFFYLFCKNSQKGVNQYGTNPKEPEQLVIMHDRFTSRPSWAERLVAFDLETTGLDPYTDRIVTAAIVLLEDGKVVERYHWLINPGIAIPPEATAIHGISTEIASSKGMNAQDAITQIVDKLLEMRDRAYTIVAFNANYDITMLYAEAARYQIADLSDIRPIADPYYIDRALDRYRRGRRTLRHVAEHYGIEMEAEHNASSDAIAAGEVLYAIAAEYVDELPDSAEEMHDMLIDWEEELTLDFKDYRKRNGEAHDDIVPGWPIKPKP